jgi:hypothetical protein
MKTNLLTVFLILGSCFGASHAMAQSSDNSALDVWFNNPSDQAAYVHGAELERKLEVCAKVPAPNCVPSPADYKAIDKYQRLETERSSIEQAYSELQGWHSQEEDSRLVAQNFQELLQTNQKLMKDHPQETAVADLFKRKENTVAERIKSETKELNTWQQNIRECAGHVKELQEEIAMDKKTELLSIPAARAN